MRPLLRYRIDPDLQKAADKLSAELGTTTGELIRLFLAECVRSGCVLLNLATGQKQSDSGRLNWLETWRARVLPPPDRGPGDDWQVIGHHCGKFCHSGKADTLRKAIDFAVLASSSEQPAGQLGS